MGEGVAELFGGVELLSGRKRAGVEGGKEKAGVFRGGMGGQGRVADHLSGPVLQHGTSPTWLCWAL